MTDTPPPPAAATATPRRMIRAGACLVLALALLAGGASFLIAERAGENMPPATVLSHMQDGNKIYLPLRAAKVSAFKKEIFRASQAGIAVIGSPGLLQIGQESFSLPFANLAGSVTLEQTIADAEDYFSDRVPAVVILGLDPWWLIAGDHASKRGGGGFFSPLSLLLSGDLTPEKAFDIALHGSGDIGLGAAMTGDGYDRSGAFHHNALVYGKQTSGDADFRAGLQAVQEGDGVFAPAADIDRGKWVTLQKFIAALKTKGAHVAVVIAPVAPPVYDAMRGSGKYGYLDKARWILRESAAQTGLTFADFLDARDIGATECEFIDSTRAGYIAYQRILLHLALADEKLRDAVRLTETGWNVKYHAGKTSTREAEADFLKIGCAKNSPNAEVTP